MQRSARCAEAGRNTRRRMNLRRVTASSSKADELTRTMAEGDELTCEYERRKRCRGRLDGRRAWHGFGKISPIFWILWHGSVTDAKLYATAMARDARRQGARRKKKETVYPAPLFIAGRSNRRTSTDLPQHGPDWVWPRDSLA